jgi:hypothetical protein
MTNKKEPRSELVMCSLRIPRELLDQVDAYALEAGPGGGRVSRNQASAYIMRRGLKDILRRKGAE